MADGQITQVANLDGVLEATLFDRAGQVVESSSRRPELGPAVVRLQQALQEMQQAIPQLGTPLVVTIDAARGSLHLAVAGESQLVVMTDETANLGEVRTEMREVLGRL